MRHFFIFIHFLSDVTGGCSATQKQVDTLFSVLRVVSLTISRVMRWNGWLDGGYVGGWSGISGRGSQTAASRLLLMTTPMACDLFMIDSFVLTSAKRVIPLAEGGRKCLIFLKYCAQIFPQ